MYICVFKRHTQRHRPMGSVKEVERKRKRGRGRGREKGKGKGKGEGGREGGREGGMLHIIGHKQF